MENKQTAVEWYWDKIKSHFEHDGDLFETATFTFAIAKEKEKEQTEQRDSVISQIDLELSLIEDYAKGEVGDAITTLRKKISNYYAENNYK